MRCRVVKCVVIALSLVWSPAYCEVTIEEQMQSHGLVDVQTVEPSILVDMKYSTEDNFIGADMYGDYEKAYLRPEIARKLVMVQKALKRIDGRYSLLIYDAARPVSAQRRMYEAVKDTPYRRYVAQPVGGGHHNFGLAVDLTIAYDGEAVDMGTAFDSFDEKSHIDAEEDLLKEGKISRAAYENRRLLRTLMEEAGFDTYKREWWHFQCHTIGYARRHFKLLDF